MANIEQANIIHLEEVSRLFDAYRVFYRKKSDIDGAQEFLKNRILSKESQIFIHKNEEGSVTGFMQLYPLFSSTRMKKLWLLNDLFVSPTYRGLGISKLLLNHAKEFSISTGACGFFLETEKSNTIGNQLYPKVGMKLNDEANFYYWDVD